MRRTRTAPAQNTDLPSLSSRSISMLFRKSQARTITDWRRISSGHCVLTAASVLAMASDRGFDDYVYVSNPSVDINGGITTVVPSPERSNRPGNHDHHRFTRQPSILQHHPSRSAKTGSPDLAQDTETIPRPPSPRRSFNRKKTGCGKRQSATTLPQHTAETNRLRGSQDSRALRVELGHSTPEPLSG